MGRNLAIASRGSDGEFLGREMQRRTFLTIAAGLSLGVARDASARTWMARKWKIDPRRVLERGSIGAFDSRITGDPCVVWDEEVHTWRMFYFASSANDPSGRAQHALVAGMALSESAEDIGPGQWHKVGEAPVANPDALSQGQRGHKWWVMMDARQPNQAAHIQGRYWALFVSTAGTKHIQVASATRLAGPWTVVPRPILSPSEEPLAPDGKHCDTPTAYWFEEVGRVLIFYKAYPLRAQPGQPGAPFGSSSVVAWWQPAEMLAVKGKQILLPGNSGAWNRGWIGGLQLLHDKAGWYAVMNGSPTPPEDHSHREPPPSLGGWAICSAKLPDSAWSVNRENSPFRLPDQLSDEERRAGLGVNFWRHHLLVTHGGRARIFFNSGRYGSEQMFSLTPEQA